MKRILHSIVLVSWTVFLLICLNTFEGYAGIPEEYYATGFFDKGYIEEEVDSAPQHDINNSIIHPVFFVDNPDDPKEFFGVYSCGHAPKEICSRVSQKELDLTREVIKNGISDFHLGFGITYAYDTQHRPEIENLWKWYKDPDTRDSHFNKYVRDAQLYSESRRQEVSNQIENWRPLLSRENILVKIENDSPIPFRARDFSLPEKVNLSHLILSKEEILTISDYITEVLDPIYDQLVGIAGSKDIEDRIQTIKSLEENKRKEFIEKRAIGDEKRIGQVIAEMKVNYSMVESWIAIQSSNLRRKELTPEKSKFFSIFQEIDSNLSRDVENIIQYCESTPLLVPLEPPRDTYIPPEGYRQMIVDGIEQYTMLENAIKSAIPPIFPVRDQFNRFDGLYQKADNMIFMLEQHAEYLGTMRKFLENTYSDEKTRSKLEEQTLREQEYTWAYTIFRTPLRYLNAYSNANSYLSFFSETNNKITTPLFLDALSRGWPGDRLFSTKESNDVSLIIREVLIDTFGSEIYNIIIREPNTFFTYSEDGLRGSLIQAISGDIILAGIPAKKKTDLATNTVFAIDPWNYRQIFTVTSGTEQYLEVVSPVMGKVEKPGGLEPPLITEVKNFSDEMKLLFKNYWPVFLIHNNTIDVCYGDVTNPVKSVSFTGNFELAEEIVTSLKEELAGVNQLRKIHAAITQENKDPEEYINQQFGQFVLKAIHESYTPLRAFQVEDPDGKTSTIKIKPKEVEMSFRLTEQSLKNLKDASVPDEILEALTLLKNQKFPKENDLLTAVAKNIGEEQTGRYQELIVKHARVENGKTNLQNDIWIADYFRERGISVPESLNVVFDEKVLEADDLLISREALASGIQMAKKAEQPGGLSPEEIAQYRQTVFKIFEEGRNIPEENLTKPPVKTNEKMRERLLDRNARSFSFYKIFKETPTQKERIISSEASQNAAESFHRQFADVMEAFFKEGPMMHSGYVHDCILRNYFIDKDEVTAIDIGSGDYIGNLGNIFSIMIKEVKPQSYEEFKTSVEQLIEDYEKTTGKKLTPEGRLEALKCMIKTPYEHSSSDSKIMINKLKTYYNVTSDEELLQILENEKNLDTVEKLLKEGEETYLRNMKQIDYTLRLLLEHDNSLEDAITPLKESLEEVIKERIRITERMPVQIRFISLMS